MTDKTLREQWDAVEVSTHYVLDQYEQLQARCAELEAKIKSMSQNVQGQRVLLESSEDRCRGLESEKARQQERIVRQRSWIVEASFCMRKVWKLVENDKSVSASVVRNTLHKFLMGADPDATEPTPHPAESEDGHLTVPCTQCGGAGWVDPVEDSEER